MGPTIPPTQARPRDWQIEARVPPARDLPPELARLLDARDPAARERAWKSFLETYNRLILHTLRRLGGEYDAVMDRYAYVLEQLSRDEFRRLRAYTPSARSKFSTWLVVVVHRVGLDHYRRRYGHGRASAAGEPSTDNPRAVRRRLVDFVAERLETAQPASAEVNNPDAALREREFQAALSAALDELSPRDRLLLKLRFELDLSARKIADIMEFPTPFHVYRRCNHVCETLRASLATRGVEDSVP
jgi:RNA polymerase sigma factor (sigma-70 family)